MSSPRFSPDAGIAIGPILFILALLGVIATALSVGSGSYGTAAISDRVSSDIVSQANLIRTKIIECNIIHGTNNNGDGWPPTVDKVNGALVADLECEGDATGRQNIWSGMRVAMLPKPTAGFTEWSYVNDGAGGGRCFWTEPTGTVGSGIADGLSAAKAKFSSREVTYNPASVSHRFVVMVTRATGTLNDNCKSE